MRMFVLYLLALALLGLRVAELNAGLPLMWHRLALLALSISMYGLAFALIRFDGETGGPAPKTRPILLSRRANSRR